jgi:hypothetical protein
MYGITYYYENVGARGVLVTAVTTDDKETYLGQTSSFIEGLHVHPDELESTPPVLVDHLEYLQIMAEKNEASYQKKLEAEAKKKIKSDSK